MYFEKCIEDFGNKKIKIFVDMDGVIADYQVGIPYDYDKKRPLHCNLQKLENVSKLDNVELHILSVSRMDEGVAQKNEWLDKYAPFFKYENRIIIPRESNDFKPSTELKSEFVKGIKRDGSIIIVIDDDCRILKKLHEENKDVILYKDTVFVD